MSLLKNISTEFDKRHDFISEDLNLLYKNYPTVKFENIPEAWIIPIDNMLCKIKNILSVSQYFGQFIVNIPNLDLKTKKIVENTQKIISNIDKDLYEF